jgi:hypothetical protein
MMDSSQHSSCVQSPEEDWHDVDSSKTRATMELRANFLIHHVDKVVATSRETKSLVARSGSLELSHLISRVVSVDDEFDENIPSSNRPNLSSSVLCNCHVVDNREGNDLDNDDIYSNSTSTSCDENKVEFIERIYRPCTKTSRRSSSIRNNVDDIPAGGHPRSNEHNKSSSDEVNYLRKVVRRCCTAALNIQKNSDLKIARLEIELAHIRQQLAIEQTTTSKLTVLNLNLRQQCEPSSGRSRDGQNTYQHHEASIEDHLDSLVANQNHAIRESTEMKKLLLSTCYECRQQLPIRRKVSKLDSSCSKSVDEAKLISDSSEDKLSMMKTGVDNRKVSISTSFYVRRALKDPMMTRKLPRNLKVIQQRSSLGIPAKLKPSALVIPDCTPLFQNETFSKPFTKAEQPVVENSRNVPMSQHSKLERVTRNALCDNEIAIVSNSDCIQSSFHREQMEGIPASPKDVGEASEKIHTSADRSCLPSRRHLESQKQPTFCNSEDSRTSKKFLNVADYTPLSTVGNHGVDAVFNNHEFRSAEDVRVINLTRQNFAVDQASNALETKRRSAKTLSDKDRDRILYARDRKSRLKNCAGREGKTVHRSSSFRGTGGLSLKEKRKNEASNWRHRFQASVFGTENDVVENGIEST